MKSILDIMDNKFLKVWFFPHCDFEEIKEISKEIDENGYDHVLLPFKSRLPDPVLRSYTVFNNTKNIGCFVAIPGYAVSPEYMIMMYRTIIDTFPNRNFILNIIDGGPDEDLSRFNINRDTDNIKSINENFAKYLKNNSSVKIAFSGMTDETSSLVKKYGEYQYVQLPDFYNFFNKDKSKNVIVRLVICARKTKKEAEEYLSYAINEIKSEPYFSKNILDRLMGNLLVGSYEDVALKIKEIKSMGALGVVVSDLALVEHDRKNVHIVMSYI
jgi:alkanesulfonate monooxygenase SsuD/methylene tetrahydromethanopterin reductase-like flavin-dependent oxidoreductase (luciferase family)